MQLKTNSNIFKSPNSNTFLPYQKKEKEWAMKRRGMGAGIKEGLTLTTDLLGLDWSR